MKTLFTTLIVLLGGIFSAQATIITILVGQDGLTFSPSSTTVSVGDTVRFEWVSGTHTTTSTSVPTGADTWNSAISSSVTHFDYKVTQEGTYQYQCNPHGSFGMKGSFSTVSTGLNDGYAVIKSSFVLSPNPVTDNAKIQFSSAVDMKGYVKVFDAAGNFVYEEKLKIGSGSNEVSFNTKSLQPGLYYLNLLDKDNAFLVVKMVKQ